MAKPSPRETPVTITVLILRSQTLFLQASRPPVLYPESCGP
jgi:hypothetical protein